MTIAQQLKIKEFPFIINDSNGREIYLENSSGYWWKKEYDSKSNEIYYQDSNGFWYKAEYDSKGNSIYRENSYGTIIDSRPKPVTELTMDEIALKFNVPVETLKIKK